MVRETSKDAYIYLRDSGALGEKRWQVYRGLYEHGPCTANELHQRMGRTLGTRNVQVNIHARLNELKRQGVVRETRKRACEVTGVVVWEVDVTKLKTPKPLKAEPSVRIPRTLYTALKEHLRTCFSEHEAGELLEQLKGFGL